MTTPDAADLRRPSEQARVFYSLSITALLVLIAYFGREVLIPLVVAMFLSFLIYTLKETVKQAPVIGPRLPGWMCYAAAFAAIAGVFLILLGIIRHNIEAVSAAAPDYERRLQGLTVDALLYLKTLGVLPDDVMRVVQEMQAQAIDWATPVVRQAGAAVRKVTESSVTIFLYTVFMLIERGRIFRKIDILSGGGTRRQAVNETIDDIGRMTRQYITVKTGANFILAVAAFIVLEAIKVDFAGFWALLVFLFNFVPIVGAVGAVAGPVLLALVQPVHGGVELALLTLVLLATIEQIMTTVIEPRLLGRSLNLSPLVILISLGVWGGVWGFAGVLLAVPMTVSLMIVLTQFRSTRPIAVIMSDDGEIAPLRHIALRRALEAAHAAAE